MRTAVLQSFRDVDVPRWLIECLASVRRWADTRGFEYLFLGDEFLSFSPRWFREKVHDQVLNVADIARLEWLLRSLETHDRAIWVDADVLIFRPSMLQMPVGAGIYFSREIWVDPGSSPPLVEKVNNSVICVNAARSNLQEYLEDCYALAKRSGVDRLAFGTRYLTQRHALRPLDLLTDIGLLSPTLLSEVCAGGGPWLQRHAVAWQSPIAGVNLCGSLRGRRSQGIEMTDSLFDDAVGMLLNHSVNGAI